MLVCWLWAQPAIGLGLKANFALLLLLLLQEAGGYTLLKETNELNATHRPAQGIAKLMEWVAAGRVVTQGGGVSVWKVEGDKLCPPCDAHVRDSSSGSSQGEKSAQVAPVIAV